jgi:glycosyltransferase involved in cell wall biosynthesis
MLVRAISSVTAQISPVTGISVALDVNREGAAVTRNRALAGVTTEWSAFLDDDDEWHEDHLLRLTAEAELHDADMVYPWFTVPQGWDPFPQYEGQPFDEFALRNVQNYIPVTVLVRTELIRDVGGFEARPYDASRIDASPCDDWGAWLKLVDEGVKIVHLNHRTWRWNWHGGNTSGRPDRW